MDSSITGVKQTISDLNFLPPRREEGTSVSGQSLMEFMVTLPLMIGLAVVMVRVNTAIQSSIVDQQYARAQAHFVTFNSPFYPEVDKQTGLISDGFNQMLMGVSDNLGTAGYSPLATVQYIGRRKGVLGDDSSQAYQMSAEGATPKKRLSVRIRNSVTLCTSNFLLGPRQPVLKLIGGGGDGSNTESAVRGVTVAGVSNLTNDSRFTYMCGSPLKYNE